MAAETYGSKGQPHFSSGGAPAIDVDPTSVADYAATVGNHIVGTTTARNANVIPGPGGAAVTDGMYWSDTTDGFTYKRISGAWVRQGMFFAMAQGIGTIGSVAAGVSINSTITFPTGRFTQPPFVYAMPASSRVTASLSSTSTTGATLNFGNWSPGAMASTGFWWLAIQMTPGTSDG